MKKFIPRHRPTSSKTSQTRPLPGRSLAVFSTILMFASLGSFLITRSQAATMTIAVEAEQGVLAGNSLARANQTGASGNGAVEFGTGGNPGGTGIDTPNNTGPNGIAGNWKIAFNDDFKGATLDESVWQRCNPSFRAACIPWNSEAQEFNASPTNNDNVVVSGGALHLVANKKNGKIWSGTVSTGPDTKFNLYKDKPAGSYKGFNYVYGVYEGRVRFPKGKGFWPSLWQLPTDQGKGWPHNGEYDVVEINGGQPTVGHFTVHKERPDGGGGSIYNGTTKPIADVSGDYHTYSLDWQPGSLTWYVDGKQVHKVEDGSYVQKVPFYIIANFSMCPPNNGDCWGGQTGGIDGSTPFPSSMDIDYLRVWKRQ